MQGICVLLLLLNISIVLSTIILSSTVYNNEEIKSIRYTKNPDQDLSTPQIIKRHGYGSESHTVVTQDGYLLTLHRISTNKNGNKGDQPVFLQHGILCSSANWVDRGDNALAFLLADAGYDVWLGNTRGNTYSTAHISIPTDSPQFWNFSFHEMGVYDLSASLRYVNNITNQGGKILYVGHSMGTTMFFVFSSLCPKEASLVEAMVALAPVVYMSHFRSPIRYFAPFFRDIEWIAQYSGLNEFLQNDKLIKLFSYTCELMWYSEEICGNIIFLLSGFDEKEFDFNLLPMVLAHTPTSTSTKTIVHYAQEVENYGNFQCFDYGKEGNLIEYGTETPPKYNLTNIKVPTYLIYGDNDWLVDPANVQKLATVLPHNVGVYAVPIKYFNHIDFLWAKGAKKALYEPLLAFLHKYRS